MNDTTIKTEIREGEGIYWKEPADKPNMVRVGMATANICERCGRVCQINGSWVSNAKDLDHAMAYAASKGLKLVGGRPEETGWNDQVGGAACESCENELAKASKEERDA
jgi:hypothetical protein